MSVTIDDLPLSTDSLNLHTVGEVLSHVAAENKLVVQLLIDGSEPDLSQLDTLRTRRVKDCSLFIETVEPQTICRDVLAGVSESLNQAETFRLEAAEAFRTGDASTGLQKLGAGFTLWTNAQDSLGKVAKLLKVDLSLLRTPDGTPILDILTAFATSLRQLKEALEARDYVLCCDVLTYDMDRTAPQWKSAIAALSKSAGL